VPLEWSVKHRPFQAQSAKRLGGERHGHLGGTDVITNWLSVECKHRQSLPRWLKDALEQAKHHADDDQLALAVPHEHGPQHDDDLVLLSPADFARWFGR
jgi:hypothetical protein